MDETQTFQDPETCPHNAFRTSLSITKIAHQGADIQRYMADVRVYCDDCNTAFRWLGLPTGASFGGPMRSADGLELRAPIAPEGERRVADEASYIPDGILPGSRT